MDNYELKPYPFCGGEAKLKHGFPGQQRQGMRQATVQCKTCGCRTVTYCQFPYEPWKNVDEKGPWANQPFLCGAYHSDGFATNFEYDIEKMKLTLYRRRPEEYNKEAHYEP